MSLIKWSLKFGPGSPGATAKVYCERYSYYYNACGGNVGEIFQVMHNERMAASRQTGNKQAVFQDMPPNFVVEEAKGDLPLFIFIMMFLETSNFRNGVISQSKLLIATIEIIHETVTKKHPDAVKYPIDQFANKVVQFMEFNYPYIRKYEKLNSMF